MRVATRYLTGLFFARFLIVLVGLSAFILSLDLLIYADEAIESRGGAPGAAFDYAVLRLPEILSQVTAIAVLIAGLTVLVTLIKHRELVATWNSGTSPLGILRGFLPLALLCGLAQITIDDLLVPRSVAQLNDWGIGEYGKRLSAIDKDSPLWLRTGVDIMRLPTANIDQLPLRDVAIFHRDETGRLLKYLRAEQATYRDGQMLLTGVTVRNAHDGATRFVEEMVWPTAMPLDSLTLSLVHPSELSIRVMGGFFDNSSFSYWPLSLYRVWYHERISAAFTPLLLLALLVMLAQGFQLRRSLGGLVLSSFAHGFGYFILDRACLALGEADLLPPMLAAWGPSLVLLLGSTGYAFRHESLFGPSLSLRSPSAVPSEGQ